MYNYPVRLIIATMISWPLRQLKPFYANLQFLVVPSVCFVKLL